MKILLITEFFPNKNKCFSGGVEARTYFLVKHLTLKHKLIVISRRKKNEQKIERGINLKIIRLGKENKEVEASFSSLLPRFLFLINAFIQALKQDFDLVEGSNFICLIPAYFAGLFKKKPVIAWYPDIYEQEWFKNFFFLTALFGWLTEKFGLILPWSAVIALSKQTKNKLIKAGINSKKIKVIYGGVDIEFVDKLKIKKYSQPTICCIARMVPYKNIDCLIKAINFVKEEIPQIKCLIIGKGPEKAKLFKLTKKLMLDQRITFKQDLSYYELIKSLKSSHLFCLPSRIEGFGLATIEALACRLPFIIADNAINKEITKGKGGLFFEINNAQDLAKKIIQIFKDKKLSYDLIKQGRKILKNYHWKEIAKQTEKVYLRTIRANSVLNSETQSRR